MSKCLTPDDIIEYVQKLKPFNIKIKIIKVCPDLWIDLNTLVHFKYTATSKYKGYDTFYDQPICIDYSLEKGFNVEYDNRSLK